MKITSKLTGPMRFDTDIRGHTITVGQPVISGGDDSGPTPPELLATSLGTCVGVYALYFCTKHQIDPIGMEVTTEYSKAERPARLVDFVVTITLPAGIAEELKEPFLATVEKCLIHNTLHEPPAVAIRLG